MTTPAPDTTTIAKVKENLRRMQAFNDYVYNNGGAYIGNCYLLMTIPDDSDPGLAIGISLLEGAFGVVGAFGAFGGFACCFMCSEVSSWSAAANTPPSLNNDFGQMVIRFQKSSMAFDDQCANYIADPAANWNKQFSWNGTSMVLGDLATIDFPLESDPEFFTMATSALKALDQTVWKIVLQENCVVTLWLTNGAPLHFSPKTNMDSWTQSFIASNPAYYVTWEYHQKSGFGDSDHYNAYEYNIGFGATKYKDNSISDPACAYLFIDSTDGHVINANGLWPRKTVFTGFGLRTDTINETTPTPTMTEHSTTTTQRAVERLKGK